jgi:hypothetical protein
MNIYTPPSRYGGYGAKFTDMPLHVEIDVSIFEQGSDGKEEKK